MNSKKASRLFCNAVIEGDVSQIKTIAESGLVIDFYIPELDNTTVLSLAVASKNDNVLAAVLEAGADPNRPNSDGMPPLLQAVMMEESAMVETLVKHGGTVDCEDGDDSSLHYAAELGDSNSLAWLLRSMRTKSIDTFDSIGMTPFMVAVSKERFTCADLLLTNGANIDAQDMNALGRTALHNAILNGAELCVVYLVEHRADPEAVDGFGSNAFNAAEQLPASVRDRMCNLLSPEPEI